jgi:fibronectin type III domain protein
LRASVALVAVTVLANGAFITPASASRSRVTDQAHGARSVPASSVLAPILPIAVPVNAFTCDGGTPTSTGEPWADGSPVMIGLCSSEPGNPGWIDWTPPAGGTSEVAAEILNPAAPALTWPTWQYLTAMGGVVGGPLEDAVNAWTGQQITLVAFDETCGGATPDGSQVDVAPLFGCPPDNVGATGTPQWARGVQPRVFRLDHAYLSGNNAGSCDGAPACLVGTFQAGPAPGAPTSVVATPGDGAAAVTWTEPEDDGGSAITGYTVTSDPDNRTCTSGDAAWCTVASLTNGTAYTFTVRATNANGTGNPSDASSPVTPSSSPTPSLSALPAYLVSTVVRLSWTSTAGTAPVVSYDVRARRAAWNGGFGSYATWLAGTAGTTAT